MNIFKMNYLRASSFLFVLLISMGFLGASCNSGSNGQELNRATSGNSVINDQELNRATSDSAETLIDTAEGENTTGAEDKVIINDSMGMGVDPPTGTRDKGQRGVAPTGTSGNGQRGVTPSGGKIPSPGNEEEYRLKVSFISYGGGINGPVKKDFEVFIKDWGKSHAPIAYSVKPWGREGERDYCFSLGELNDKEIEVFLKEVKAKFDGKDRVLIK